MNLISVPTRVLLALSAIKGVGPSALKKVSGIPAFWECALEDWAAAAPQIARSIEGQTAAVWQKAQQWADEQVVAADKYHARIISAVDDEYPRLLAATKDDPFLLYVKGKFPPEPQRSVAIIGTREPTQHGVMIAQRITQFFVEQRWSVVSGLALGCDSIAHQAALDAGGHTVAVMAHGLQMVAPSRHKKLAQDILDAGGALVSEYPFGRDAMGSQFVKRDRTQAGIAQGVVMIQSDVKGGSLHASRAALDYQRWLAVPYPTDRDLENAEPKVQANLVLADGTDAQRADLLRCPISALRLVEVVRGRDDYLKLLDQGTTASPDSAPGLLELTPDAEPLHEDAQLEPAPQQSPSHHLQSTPVAAAEEAPPPLREEAQLEPASPQQTPTDRPRPISAAAAEKVAPSDEVPSTEEVAPSGKALTRGRSYYLEVSPEDLANLKAARIPIASAESGENLAASKFDIDIVVTVSRLGHLQTKLDELRKARSKRPIDDQRALRFKFQVEDVLTHMKRAADQLLNLDHGVHRKHLLSILVKHDAASGQPELPLMGAAASQWDAPFIEVLDQLVDTLPRSVSVHGHKVVSDGADAEAGVEVHLSDLLFTFNDLVRTVLPQGSYASTTTLDGQA